MWRAYGGARPRAVVSVHSFDWRTTGRLPSLLPLSMLPRAGRGDLNDGEKDMDTGISALQTHRAKNEAAALG